MANVCMTLAIDFKGDYDVLYTRDYTNYDEWSDDFVKAICINAYSITTIRAAYLSRGAE